HVVEEMTVALNQADDDIKGVLLRQGAKVFGRGTRYRLGDVCESLAEADVSDGLAEDDEVRLLFGRLRDKRFIHPAVVQRRLAAARPEVDRGQAGPSGRRR